MAGLAVDDRHKRRGLTAVDAYMVGCVTRELDFRHAPEVEPGLTARLVLRGQA